MASSRWCARLSLVAIQLLAFSTVARAQTTHEPVDVPALSMPGALPQDDPMLAPVAPAAHVVASFEQALAALRARSTDLRIALADIERSEGQWRMTLANSLPQLSGNGNVTRNLLRGDQTLCDPLTRACTESTLPDAFNYSASLNLSQPILAPRAWHALGTADVSRRVARLSLEEQKRLLTIALANSVVSVVTAERLSEVNRVGLRAALDRATLARRRQALGAGNALDTVRADQDVAVARTTLVSGDESLRQARETLGLALGSTEAFGVAPTIDLNGLEASARASCSSSADLGERADIAAAQANTELTKRNVTDVWLQFSPTVSLASTLTAGSSRFANGQHEAWTISGLLSVPFYDGGARYGALRDTRAQVEQSEQRLEAARRNATVEINQARRNVQVADESRTVAEQSRNLAREVERLSRLSFQMGTGTSLDLIESGRRLREAEIQLALREFGLVQARIGALLALSRCHW
jgi:outer membrane protein TolC